MSSRRWQIVVLLCLGLALVLPLCGQVIGQSEQNAVSRVLVPLVANFEPPAAAPPPTSTQAAGAPTQTALATATATATSTSAATATSTATATAAPVGEELEGFEDPPGSWQVSVERLGGNVSRSEARAAAGQASARAATSGPGQTALVRVGFSAPANERIWEERPGVWHWQRASIYLPASTVAELGASDYLTLGGMWSSGAGYGWYLRVRQNGELYVVGQRDFDNTPVEFRIYGRLPTDRWVELELGLHSQNGPGVKRAFAVVIDGAFYGWYRQGRLKDETYDRVALGILETNSARSLEVFIDRWKPLTTAPFPGGPDSRSSASLQEQDYRTQSGVQWQIDWTTWDQDLRLDAQHGLYSAVGRLQSGRNIDRMPDLTSGWAEIEIDLVTGGLGPTERPSGAFAGMVGFRKEINREENLEVAPVIDVDGRVRLHYGAWVGEPIVFAQWELPVANGAGNGNRPESGDVLRVRWEQVNSVDIHVLVSYYDASTNTWHHNIIDDTRNLSAVQGAYGKLIDYSDGYHVSSSITVDTPTYSVRRYKVGLIATYPLR